MSGYQPGTVAVATVRGVPGVRVMWRDAESGWLAGWFAGSGNAYTPESEVTDIRPLVVLDLGDDARWHARVFRESGFTDLADQIEAQTKPARIPEPGLWGVVEATAPIRVKRCKFVRHSGNEASLNWLSPSGEWFAWSDLIDPVLVREGVGS